MGEPCAALVPTRGRPASVEDLLGVAAATSACTDWVFALDDDDPAAGRYEQVLAAARDKTGHVTWHTGPRDTLTGWTNRLAAAYRDRYEALISLGDDHRPLTPAWDAALLDAARAMGGGWAYGDDGLQHENLPTAFLVSSAVVRALGWVLLPSCRHMFVDAAARDLAEACGRRAYLPGVHVRHLHYTAGRSRHDQTYAGGYASWPADEAAYRAYTAPGGQLGRDAETVKAALG